MKSGTIYCRSRTVVAVHEAEPPFYEKLHGWEKVFLAKCKDKAIDSEHVLALFYHTVNAYDGLELYICAFLTSASR